jgi:molybdate transport system permease protein
VQAEATNPARASEQQAQKPTRSGRQGELLFAALLSTLLFAYAGFILAVIWADVAWLAMPGAESGKRGITKVLTSPDVATEVLTALKLSLVTSFISSILAMTVAIPSAYALSRYRLPFRSLIDTVIDLPIVIPPLIAGISLLIFFNQMGFGIQLEKWLRVVYSQRGIVVAQFFIASAFCIRATKAAIDQVNPRFESVARSLGCGPVRAFWQITLPLAKTGLMAGWIMTWARAMGEFAPIMVFAGATPLYTAVLPVTAFLNLSVGNIETSVAVTVLMIVIASVTLLLFKKLGGQGYLW